MGACVRNCAYLLTVLWVGTSVKASRSAPPRLEVLLVPFLPSNQKTGGDGAWISMFKDIQQPGNDDVQHIVCWLVNKQLQESWEGWWLIFFFAWFTLGRRALVCRVSRQGQQPCRSVRT